MILNIILRFPMPVIMVFGILFSEKSLAQNNINNAHSHNDYLNKRPLFSALENNFKSIEVDVFLLKSDLYVGHNWLQLRKNKTIEKLYLGPLWKLFNKNKGFIYQNRAPLFLLVDIKTAAKPTYDILKIILKKYKPMLTRVVSDSLVQGSVTIILSGNKPSLEDFKYNIDRFVFLDGRFSNISKNISNLLMPIISIDWSDHFKWKGMGTIPKKELIVLNDIINKIHLEKKQLRFWASPDNKNGWIVLENAGVDLINTDKINKFSSYKIQN